MGTDSHGSVIILTTKGQDRVIIVLVFDQGVWTTLKELDDPEILCLARKLPATVLQN